MNTDIGSFTLSTVGGHVQLPPPVKFFGKANTNVKGVTTFMPFAHVISQSLLFLCNTELRNPVFSCIEMTLGDHNRPLFSFVDLHILVFATSSWKRSEQRGNELALFQDSQLRARAVIVTVSTERGTS